MTEVLVPPHESTGLYTEAPETSERAPQHSIEVQVTCEFSQHFECLKLKLDHMELSLAAELMAINEMLTLLLKVCCFQFTLFIVN